MLITEWNWDDAKDVWQEEARDEGRVKGISEGYAKKALEIARKMKNMGRPPAEIVELTGLSSEAVEQIG
jgi:predicted transposase/invertase (TIGR01784 family)